MALVNKEAVCGGLEWRVTVPEGSLVKVMPESGLISKAWQGLLGLLLAMKLKLWGFMEKVWKIGASDPRMITHCLKVGLALTLVSLLYYVRPLYDGVGGTAMGAVLTVVVIFEYTVGATLYKGINRLMATLLAVSLAIGIHYLADKSGKKVEVMVRVVSVFILASLATFSRFIPSVKAQFDYGMQTFIGVFILVSVSGYRVDKVLNLAQQRVSTIFIGCSICTLISMFICPVWAGNDLHLLITRNMENLANSIDGSVAEYFKGSESVSDGAKPSHKMQGHKSTLNTKGREDFLANFARWEPAHGQFGFRHPWKQYLKIGAALRYCSYCIEALDGCMNTEIQAPHFIENHLQIPCTRLCSQSAIVLKELANSTRSMIQSSSIVYLLEEMNNTVEELEKALKTLPSQAMPAPPSTPADTVEKKNSWPIDMITTTSVAEALPLLTAASILLEISARVEGVANEVDDLTRLADFQPSNHEKLKKLETTNKSGAV